ncbi:MAG TPA: GNAT family N-acetyltransferase [Candidatus Angelobacter sp.]|nr:GNAT family N-acetyltransferase [Candidatus Angelobacter sp.]
MNLQKGPLEIRSLRSEDKGALVKWLSDPLVLEYYEGRDRPFDLEQVEEKFYQSDKNVQRCLISFEGNKIGYLQFYLLDDEGKAEYGYPNLQACVFGMDQFIGEKGYWGHGVGTSFVKMILEYLTKQEKADRVVLDPQAWNTRAIRCYEKCGFKKVRLLEQHEWHEGEWRDCVIMEYQPAK